MKRQRVEPTAAAYVGEKGKQKFLREQTRTQGPARRWTEPVGFVNGARVKPR